MHMESQGECILWLGLAIGCGISQPTNGALYGDSALSWAHWTQVPWRLGTIVSFPLACEDIDHLGLPSQMRSSPHHGGVTSGVVDESMGSYQDASREHEQSCGVVDGMPDLSSSVYGEQSGDSRGDIQDDESHVMIHHEQHMVEHESVKEEDMHNMHDDPFGESQLEDHVEPMMEEDE